MAYQDMKRYWTSLFRKIHIRLQCINTTLNQKQTNKHKTTSVGQDKNSLIVQM